MAFSWSRVDVAAHVIFKILSHIPPLDSEAAYAMWSQFGKYNSVCLLFPQEEIYRQKDLVYSVYKVMENIFSFRL